MTDLPSRGRDVAAERSRQDWSSEAPARAEILTSASERPVTGNIFFVDGLTAVG